MERKTTQRIIGILVVAALIVISLPLLFGGTNTDAPVQSAEMKAPPFPDQQETQNSVTISQNTADSINPQASTITVQSTDAQPVAETAKNTSATASPATTPATTTAQNTATANTTSPASTTAETPVVATSSSTSAPSTSNATASDSVASTTTPVVTASNSTTEAATANVATPVTTAATDMQPAVATQEATPAAPKAKHIKQAKLKQREVAPLKTAAWVVQMGSFKNKMNALRLANQLRALGYKAFTQNRGNSMRVYVGPELKQASASSLANQIQEKINMQGIVVFYHPMEI